MEEGRRVLTVKPRRRGYTHRPIIAICDNVGMTENYEIITDLPKFALTETHVWVTHDVTELLNTLIERFTDSLRYTFMDSRDPEVPDTIQYARLSTFGFVKDSIPGQVYGKQALHSVWNPARMFSTPKLAVDFVGNNLLDLLSFAVDVRDWCKENDLPLKSTLPGLASSLLRDKRFWPNDRGRVPRATNERIRRYLPGVYQERRAERSKTYPNAIALDQERAYHRAAQEVPIPDPTNLYARGYFNDPEGAPNLWAEKGTELYERTIKQPGLVAVMASSRPAIKDEWRPPVCCETARCIRYIWTNEVEHCESHGLNIEGIAAAWTSETRDWGLAEYGLWAEAQIDHASDYRRNWLKPTLHSLYGLLGARPRDILTGRSHGKGEETIYTMRGYAYRVFETVLHNRAPITANVAALGTLQSAIRLRTLDLANTYGDSVLHVHADGMHLDAIQLRFIPYGWSVESVSNLFYVDDVSWTSNEKDVLPGRNEYERIRLKDRLRREFENAGNYLSKERAKGRQNRVA